MARAPRGKSTEQLHSFAKEAMRCASYKGEEGISALHIAVLHESIEMTKQLCMLGVDVNIKDEHGRTPLHRAAYCGNVEVVKGKGRGAPGYLTLRQLNPSTILICAIH